MAQDTTQNHPNRRWWNGPNVIGGNAAPGNGSGSTVQDVGARYQGTGPGTVYIGRNAAGVDRNQPGPNVAGASRSVNNT